MTTARKAAEKTAQYPCAFCAETFEHAGKRNLHAWHAHRDKMQASVGAGPRRTRRPPSPTLPVRRAMLYACPATACTGAFATPKALAIHCGQKHKRIAQRLNGGTGDTMPAPIPRPVVTHAPVPAPPRVRFCFSCGTNLSATRVAVAYCYRCGTSLTALALASTHKERKE